MRLLIECTNVYDQPAHNSGIPRVVRNIISNLDRIESPVTAIPVVIRKNKVYAIRKLPSVENSSPYFNSLTTRLIQIRNRYWWYHSRIERLWLFRTSRFSRRLLRLFFNVSGVCFDLPHSGILRLRHRLENENKPVELKVETGDVLILLDATWVSDLYPSVNALKSKGVIIVAVIYDLIALTHPQFFKQRLVELFEDWFHWIVQTADGFMAISKTIRDQMQMRVISATLSGTQKQPWFDYFHLGTELDLMNIRGSFRQHVKTPFGNGRKVYLMVGTIEPRKNHGYLIDAFDLLWHMGMALNLLFVGKIGWKCQSILKRIKEHPMYNRYLFMFNDLSDLELEYCYKNARSLLFPSFMEGFGLPLVEAMQRGLPVMASDIPIFHEIGGDFMAYFNLDNPSALVSLIQGFEKDGDFPAPKKLSESLWLNWEASTRQLLSKVLAHVSPKTIDPKPCEPALD